MLAPINVSLSERTWDNSDECSSYKTSAGVLDFLGEEVGYQSSVRCEEGCQQHTDVSDVDCDVECIKSPENKSSGGHQTYKA